jgi:hypothetical protein
LQMFVFFETMCSVVVGLTVALVSVSVEADPHPLHGTRFWSLVPTRVAPVAPLRPSNQLRHGYDVSAVSRFSPLR